MKYPRGDVNGVLIGKADGENSMSVADVVPLFHSQIAVTPSLEVALEQVSMYAKECGGCQVVGYYQANQLYAVGRRKVDPLA